ncbi:hypothetical protein GWI33_022112 [Rhynchophorus ferrugineus]|uniref:Uncharacterized protein n=1 Tax=Rhynchophorus ferrugineus TaxID=354439 RepID=A0A834IRA1_RHYFE|nr:hypothetical protein GWI33_022112 [Rhynchophorus ferrugineus]
MTIFKSLREAGIEPIVTIFHWDLIEYLGLLRGWMNPRMADCIGQYVRISFKYFGEYIKYWVSLNEPNINCIFSYEEGTLALGLQFSGQDVYQCAYTQVLSHTTGAFKLLNVKFSYNQFTINQPVGEDYYSAPSMAQYSAYVTSTDPSWLHSSDGRFVSDSNGFRSIINFVNDCYKPKEIFITENGWSDTGELEDNNRITYLNDSLNGILNSIVIDGVNVKGYTMWSLLDNFEWTSGYMSKFGIVQVDFDSPNRTRTLKKSAEWYQNVVATGRLDK